MSPYLANRFGETTTLRALMVSDVYFPRINGVSTSIETFRGALATQGVGYKETAEKGRLFDYFLAKREGAGGVRHSSLLGVFL